MSTVSKIISGGQTGADTAALDFALQHGIPHGGWCPKGRSAEDGRIPDKYALQETKTSRYAERTRLNVQDSDGTLIFSRVPLSGGTILTADLCQRMGKPTIVIEPTSSIEDGAVQVRQFLETHSIRVLNVAGPRASTDPSVYGFTKAVLREALIEATGAIDHTGP
ncbi:MAG: putative molybdenum carrier protein [Verrucomicrobiia bacterium]